VHSLRLCRSLLTCTILDDSKIYHHSICPPHCDFCCKYCSNINWVWKMIKSRNNKLWKICFVPENTCRRDDQLWINLAWPKQSKQEYLQILSVWLLGNFFHFWNNKTVFTGLLVAIYINITIHKTVNFPTKASQVIIMLKLINKAGIFLFLLLRRSFCMARSCLECMGT